MITFEIKGIRSLAKNLRQYPRESAKEIQGALLKSIFVVERKSKKKTPVDTGRLRAGYRHSFGLLKARLYNPVSYAFKQHEGVNFRHTVGEAKFMEKALRESIGMISGFFEQALEDVLRKVAKIKRR
ncbi:hypothetical protein LCGC14_0961330 [marine sediment metagenome]|uniref:HK97 gp10 family phage protein n=1 Tax=marine sediment metagenome TaxID=412755 RepID=A0A0F9NJ16_9ZZZZ